MGMKAKTIAQTIRVENWYYIEPGDGSMHYTQCTMTRGPLCEFTNPNGFKLAVDITDPKIAIYDDLTAVIFRVWRNGEMRDMDGDVIAVFPEQEGYGPSGHGCVCFQHIGQHGETDRNIIMRTRPAKPEEYADLQKELESEPYNYRFHIIKRWPRR